MNINPNQDVVEVKEWFPSDTEARFKEHLAMPDKKKELVKYGWAHPRTFEPTQILYTVNEFGFRGESFDNISDSPSDSPEPAPVTINSFISNNYSLSGSGTVTLSWNISNATNASINYTSSTGSLIQTSVSPVSGLIGITVSNTTTFTLTATNSGGSVTRSLTVTVASGSSLAINYFTASPSSVASGSPVNLSWSASGAVSATISSIGSVSPLGGNTTVYPFSSRSYTLTIYSSTGQSTSRSVYVNVSGIPLGEGDNL